jgi:preprotein translocase subunit SecD
LIRYERDAWSSLDQLFGPVVMVRFNSTHQLGEVTQANVDRSLAFVFDREVLSTPAIREPILAETAQIDGACTVEQSVEMATLLRAGELPARLVVLHKDSSN